MNKAQEKRLVKLSQTIDLARSEIEKQIATVGVSLSDAPEVSFFTTRRKTIASVAKKLKSAVAELNRFALSLAKVDLQEARAMAKKQREKARVEKAKAKAKLAAKKQFARSCKKATPVSSDTPKRRGRPPKAQLARVPDDFGLAV